MNASTEREVGCVADPISSFFRVAWMTIAQVTARRAAPVIGRLWFHVSIRSDQISQLVAFPIGQNGSP